ncbi:MAG: flavodoxin family protein [Actinobacteria bacterium]|nr:flavodoxin family protein [Actinomycetota bacterium]
MLIVGINGSPDGEGNTAYILNRVLTVCKSKGADTEVINVMNALEGQKWPYCKACGSPCPGICHENENLSNAYDLLVKADALVVGSPVYFGTVTAQLKAFWDKSRNLRRKKALVGKPAGAVTVAAAKYGGQETTMKAIHDILMVHGMRIIGDGSIESGAGHQGVCAQRPSNEDVFAIERAAVLAEAIVEALGN